MALMDLVEFSKCFASESRAKLIRLLAERELCVCELEAVTGQTQSSISQHLRVLFQAGLVEKRRDGQWIYYSLNRSHFQQMVAELQEWMNAPLEQHQDFAEEFPRYAALADNERVKKCKGLCK